MNIMGIKDKKTEMPERGEIKDETFEDNVSGTYNMIRYIIGWSLDLSSNTIKVNIVNNPDFDPKVITENNTVAEYQVDEPWYKKFLAKISADFNLKQLALNGRVTYLTSSPRPSERAKTKIYENVILTTW